MAGIVLTEAHRMLDASLRGTAYTLPTTTAGAMKLALCTSAPTATAAGTEVTGGSYARQDCAFSAASAGATANTSAVTFTNMPAATVTHIDIYDAAGSPRRVWFGPLTASKTTQVGDSISFSPSAIGISLG